MTITIELETDAAAVAQTQARAHGLNVNEFLSRHVEEYLRSLSAQAGMMQPDGRVRFSQEQFERDWDEFSAGTEHLPILSDGDLSREAVYADHD
jgi:hypothetical protein